MTHHDRDTAVLAANSAVARTRTGRLERGEDLLLGSTLLALARVSPSRTSRLAGTLIGGPLLACGVLGARPRLVRGVNVVESVIVNRSPEECFASWMSYEEFPSLMKNVKEVTRLSDGVSRWVVRGFPDLTWYARIVKVDEGRLIEWRTLPGSDVSHAGSVRFEPSGSGCKLTVTVRYEPRALLARVFAWFSEGPATRIAENLERMKMVLETQEPLVPS
jgi:uncharacterized membrane protein